MSSQLTTIPVRALRPGMVISEQSDRRRTAVETLDIARGCLGVHVNRGKGGCYDLAGLVTVVSKGEPA